MNDREAWKQKCDAAQEAIRKTIVCCQEVRKSGQELRDALREYAEAGAALRDLRGEK